MSLEAAPPAPPALPPDYSGPALHAAPPPAAPAAPPAAPPAAVAPPPPAAPPPPPAPAPAVRGHGGPMDDEAIADRVKREKKKQLKELYGTDDEDQIVTIKAKRVKDEEELVTLRSSKEKADRDQMTEVQRLTTDLETANKKIADLEAKLASKDREVMSSKQEANLAGRLIAHKFIQKPAAQMAVKVALKNHFDALSKTAQAVFVKTGELDRWLKRFATDNPYLVEAAAPAAPAAPPAPAPRAPAAPVRVPAGGARPPVPPRAATPTTLPDPLEGKTPLPNRPNSMTPAELKQYMTRGRRAG